MRRTPFRRKPPADHRFEPGYATWHQTVWGECQVCGVEGTLLRHHVVLEQHVRAAGGDPHDLRNGLLIGIGDRCPCHRRHHSATNRIPLALVPDDAIAFAVDLFGEQAAALYLARYYAP